MRRPRQEPRRGEERACGPPSARWRGSCRQVGTVASHLVGSRGEGESLGPVARSRGESMVAVTRATKAADAPGGRGAQALPPRDEIAACHLLDETRLVGGLIERAVYTEDERRRTADLARRLVHAARAHG